MNERDLLFHILAVIIAGIVFFIIKGRMKWFR